MSATGHWETVGNSKLNTKMQKRVVSEKMPKQDSSVEPLQLSKTMFDAFEEKPKNNVSGKPLQTRSNNQSSGIKKVKKKAKPTSSKYKHERFEDAVKEVSVITVNEKATQCRNRFPKNPSIWLKDIAGFLNDTISCPDTSPAFLDRPFDYPISKASKLVNNMLQKLFVEEMSDVVKEIMFEHCMRAMLDGIASDHPTWGYRLCLQALAHGSPKVCCKYLDNDLEKISNMKNVPKRCLAYLWALGQVGVNDAQCGMKVWLKVMLPMIKHKALAGYVVQYLEQLLARTKDPVERMSGSISADDFLVIMRWCFDPNTGLSTTLRERLCDMYRPMRLLATGNGKLKLLLFKRFLQMAPDENSGIKSEVLEVVFECLQATQQCFSAWREAYMTSIPQTRVLLEYLDSRWVESLHKLPRNQFKETIQAFHNTNVDAATQSLSITSLQEFKVVNDVCRHMHQKLTEESHKTLSRCHHVFLPLIVALLAIGVGLFMYDVQLNGWVIENSYTYKTLDKSGVLDIMKQAQTKISVAMHQIMAWLKLNVPYHWSKLKNILAPYFSYVSAWLSDVIEWTVAVTAPARANISEWTQSALLVADGLFKRAMAASADYYEAARPHVILAGTWMAEKMSNLFAFFRGEIHWCCVRDAVFGYARYAYESVVGICVLAWSYVLHVTEMTADYVAGKNM